MRGGPGRIRDAGVFRFRRGVRGEADATASRCCGSRYHNDQQASAKTSLDDDSRRGSAASLEMVLNENETAQLRAALQDAVVKCSERCLYQSAKWSVYSPTTPGCR